jgi:hypothetical protein
LNANNNFNKVNQQIKPQSTKEKCETIMDMLKGHPNISHFFNPLDPMHPKFLELSREFINFNHIEVKFKKNEYNDTISLGNDIRKMWNCGFKLFENEPERLQ